MDRKLNLSASEISRPFEGELGKTFPVILSPILLAQILGLPVKTIYRWISIGRLNGCYRKRGKRCLIWRDRALNKLFNGEPWDK